jgi:hypothetical protein
VVYRHEVQVERPGDKVHPTSQVFVLDTREIREVLGDEVPFSEPEVLAFLRSTLEEGVASLRRGYDA